MTGIINILKNIGIATLVMGALILLGNAINALIPFEWLSYIFIIFRKLFNFLAILPIDMTAFGVLISGYLGMKIASIGFIATLKVINYFKKD